MCQPRFMSDYTALKVTALDAVNELLNHVGWGADDGSERCAIIGVCKSHITENIDKIATTREQAFALIDEVAQQMKSKRRSRPIRKGLAWGLQSVDQRVCKSLAGGMEAATTENYEVRPNDQGRSSSIRDCG